MIRRHGPARCYTSNAIIIVVGLHVSVDIRSRLIPVVLLASVLELVCSLFEVERLLVISAQPLPVEQGTLQPLIVNTSD